MGITLPDDYKEFISIYGTGSIQDFMRVWNYADLRGKRTPRETITLITGEYEWDRNAGFPIDFKQYPEPGGLIPFASTNDGAYLNWHAEGEPDQWFVVAYDPDQGKLLPAPGIGMLQCLLLLLQQKDPFSGDFCNVEIFESPVTFAVWEDER